MADIEYNNSLFYVPYTVAFQNLPLGVPQGLRGQTLDSFCFYLSATSQERLRSV